MNIAWETVAPVRPPLARSAEQVIGQALSECGQSPGFVGAAGLAGEPVLLVVNDSHRSTQTRPALMALAAFVESAVRAGGVRFRALVAAGTHRFSSEERRAFEQSTFEGCGLNIEAISWHDAGDASVLVEVAGVKLHRWVVESRFLLPIGSVEHCERVAGCGG